jgi:anaerobic magnesium-protoporphyrin IX monomethyl ester cyclase
MTTVALVNPPWQILPQTEAVTPFAFHTPLAYLYAMAHMPQSTLIDGHVEGWGVSETVAAVVAANPERVVMTTAPGYGPYWRVPSPDLSLPIRLIRELKAALPEEVPVIACGPHGSSTPEEILKILDCDGLIRGEPESVLPELDDQWRQHPTVYTPGKHAWNVEKAATQNLEELHLPLNVRYTQGMDYEWSRGCEYACTFCNRGDFRTRYRERSLEAVVAELEKLHAAGCERIHWIDDLFGLGHTPDLLMRLRTSRVPAFSLETRVDLWDEKGLDFLAAAGCHWIEFGLETPFLDEQKRLQRNDVYPMARAEAVLAHAASRFKTVRLTLSERHDLSDAGRQALLDWREKMLALGLEIDMPRRLFPYPGTLYYKTTVAAEPLLADGPWDKANKFYASALSANLV